MKTLIVDDDELKFKKIRAALEAAGCNCADIVVAGDGIAARERLASERFDFVVVDMLLPLRVGGEADKRGGMNLLTEICRSSRLQKPPHVLALTGYRELRAEFESKFNEGEWAIDSYDASDSGWSDRLVARAKYILSSERTPALHDLDVLVITALGEVELRALRRLDWKWSDAISFNEMTYMYRGEIEGPRAVVALAAPRMGMVASATLLAKAIERFMPRLVVMTGICAGFRNVTNIGDVICANPAWDWQMGKYTSAAFRIEPDQIHVSAEITSKVELLREDAAFLARVWAGFDGDKPDIAPRFFVAPMASGSSVLADGDTSNTVRDQHRKVRAVDMEVYGVYSAVRDAAKPKPLVAAFKSVCDHADHQKNDKFQRYAAYVSARVLDEFLRRYVSDLLG